jgi:ribulose 1,5-bisphosphate synthetase/thiazole synthase
MTTPRLRATESKPVTLFKWFAGISGSWTNLASISKLRNGGNTMAKERLIVVGGDAAGMSAASQAKRRRPDLEIVVFERSPNTSYSA